MFGCYSEFISAPGKLKNMPDRVRNRTYDLQHANPMLCQLSFVVMLESRFFDSNVILHVITPKILGLFSAVARHNF